MTRRPVTLQPKLTGFPVKWPLEELLFETSSVAVGSFRCSPDHERFTDTGPSSTHCFVFPRTSVWIQLDGEPQFLSDPTIVTLYNQGQRYKRRAFSRAGDQCYWFAVSQDSADEAAIDTLGNSVPRGPFVRAFIRADDALYVAHFRTLLHLRRHIQDPLFVDETVLGMFRSILRRSRTCNISDDAYRATVRQRRLVDGAKVLLTLWTTRRVLLAELSKELGCSAFHLCHLFRSMEGKTLHEYQTQLRLRAAVQCLLDCRSKDLAQLAIELGFCSHSHFSAAFRRTFGTPPSTFVKQMSGTEV